MSVAEIERHLLLGGSFFSRGLMVAARDAWEKALDMLSPSSPAGYGVRVHNALGSLFLELRDYTKALHHFQGAKSFCAKAGNRQPEYSRVLNNLALSYLHMGDVDLALPLSLEAVKLFPSDGPLDLHASVKLVAGVSLLNHEEWDQARRHLECALDMFSKMGSRTEVGMCLNNLGIIAMEQGDLDTAGRLLEAALSALDSVHDVALRAYARSELGRLQFKRGDIPEALHQGSAALHILWNNMGWMDRAEVARLCRLFGSIFTLKGDRSTALGYLQRATTYFAQSQMWREWALATEELNNVIRRRNLQGERIVVEWHDQELLRHLTTLLGLMDTLESLYPESLSNLELVIHYARVLGDAIGLGETCLSRLMTAARLRDVGLTTDNGIDSSEKAGSTHPEISERMLVMFGVPDEVLRAVRYHHENFDGSGYPEGLRGQDIPMEARILNLVERYVNAVKCEIKNGHGFHERAMQRILSTREHFDPHLLATFEELHSTQGLYKC